MDTSGFSFSQHAIERWEPVEMRGGSCDTFRVKLYGKLHFLKRLKPELAADIRYREALRKEFETGYRLEHLHLVRYVSMSDDGILMEYVDGETLTQRLERTPDYFCNRKHTDKLLCQLLSVVGYLHAHQVLHLDLKPDNILLTRIGDDVKLIDLGCCHTDTFIDTTGHTTGFAAPEQLQGGAVDERTDIYAIGRIMELLPNHHIYNKVIARCTAEAPSARFPLASDVAKAISNQRRPHRISIAITASVVLALAASAIVFWPPHDETTPIAPTNDKDTLTLLRSDTSQNAVANAPAVTPSVHVRSVPAPSPLPSVTEKKDMTVQMDKELDSMLDSAFRATIATFSDSVFPSPSVGQAWRQQTTEFHAQVLQSAASLSQRYPDIPETVIMQRSESRFQALVTHVFNRMRKNGESL